MSGYGLILAFFILLILRVPIGFAMAISCIAYLLLSDLPLTVVPQVMMSLFENFPFLAIPFFALAGQLMNTGGIAKRLFGFAHALVGHIPGALGHANIVASIIFAGMSGSAVADSAGVGPIEIKAMVDDGYDADFSAAVTAASSTIGPIIPPSIPFIIYGAMANVSVGALFMGGFIPGFIMGLALMVVVYFISRKRNYRIYKRSTLKQLWDSFLHASLPLLTPVIIMGGVIVGIATPTESAVLAVIYAMVLGLFIYKESSLKSLLADIGQVSRTVGMIAFLSCAAFLFGWILTYEKIPQQFGDLLISLTSNKYVVLLIINILLLIVGCFMDTIAAMVVLIPVFLPTLGIYEIDRVHFGVVLTLNLMIGLLTPPVGMCSFLVARIANVPFEKVIKAELPFIYILIVVLMIITYVPETVMFLPKLLIK
jgi:tripartite ATP-independent transporter DctM subunit